MSSLRDQLDGLLEQLLRVKSKLQGHEPAHVIPADVEKQIKELMVRFLSLARVCVFECLALYCAI